MTDEHRLVGETTRPFFREEIVRNERDWEKAGQVDLTLWRSAGCLGLLGSGVATELGGPGDDNPTDFGVDAIICEGQGRVNALDWGCIVQGIVKKYVLVHSTP